MHNKPTYLDVMMSIIILHEKFSKYVHRRRRGFLLWCYDYVWTHAPLLYHLLTESLSVDACAPDLSLCSLRLSLGACAIGITVISSLPSPCANSRRQDGHRRCVSDVVRMAHTPPSVPPIGLTMTWSHTPSLHHIGQHRCQFPIGSFYWSNVTFPSATVCQGEFIK